MNEQLSQGINPLTLSSPGNAYCVPMGARSPSPALRPHHVCSRVLNHSFVDLHIVNGGITRIK